MQNGDLKSYLLRSKEDPDSLLSPAALLVIAISLADVMMFLETNRVLHRDLAARYVATQVLVVLISCQQCLGGRGLSQREDRRLWNGLLSVAYVSG